MKKVFLFILICVLSAGTQLSAQQETYTMTVKYGKSIKKLVKESQSNWPCGAWCKYQERRSLRYLIKRNKTKEERKLFHKETLTFGIFSFNTTISTDEAINSMDTVGYRPATTFELLLFCSFIPDSKDAHSYDLIPLARIPNCEYCLTNNTYDAYWLLISYRDLSEVGVFYQYRKAWFQDQLEAGNKGVWQTNCRFLAVKK